MARFYELHIGEGLPSPIALSRAQIWLRAATNLDLQGYARLAAKEGRLDSDHVAEIEEELTVERLRPSRNNSAIEWIAPVAARTSGERPTDAARWLARPYAHPYFWAGFIHTGL
jgi:CHAT domain-containing protein